MFHLPAGIIPAALALICLYSFSSYGSPGDRASRINIIYPDAAFYHHGGRVIDVTRPPFNAKGNGTADDTRALIRAYDTVATAMLRHGWKEATDKTNAEASFILYFPKGTYKISNTLIYSLPRLDYGDGSWGGVVRVRIVGQKRDSTIIRLADSSPGFGNGSYKPVVSYEKNWTDQTGTNIPGSNQLRNVTIHTGNGNPGAVGVHYLSANTGSMDNVSIISGDSQGNTGLCMPVFSVQCHIRDVTIDGFDHGIRMVSRAETNPSLEYVTLRNQRISGVRVEKGSPCFRRLLYVGPNPGIEILGPAAQVVVVDSRFEKGSSDKAAIDLVDTLCQLLARDITVEGYGTAIKRGKKVVETGDVTEYVSSPPQSLRPGQKKATMRLPVEDAPEVYWEQDLKMWANVDSFPGADDAARVQNAMNSGATTVFFPKARYTIKKPVLIPPSVRRIDFLYCRPNNSVRFVIEQGSGDPLWIESITGRTILEQKAPRTVIIRQSSMNYRYPGSGESKLFIESCANNGYHEQFCPSGLRIWARGINCENKKTSNIKVYGGTMWTLGYKTEGGQMSYDVRKNGRCEVLGGYRNETQEDLGLPMVFNDTSHVSFSGFTSMGRIYQHAVWEVVNGDTLRLMRTDVPPRVGGYKQDFFIPLYAGYDDSAVKPDTVSIEPGDTGKGPGNEKPVSLFTGRPAAACNDPGSEQVYNLRGVAIDRALRGVLIQRKRRRSVRLR